ncbi:hypothetical protein SLNSH_13655 [Alsobacter soli]|uniref:Uncharacterized protein n=2 Tax=Alsobacter soli TaxID=2109933 RepID=A0A2T1HSC5_9HYPH|nr:hypothetical protein SLNSH_13655 [Alsobacter soli]
MSIPNEKNGAFAPTVERDPSTFERSARGGASPPLSPTARREALISRLWAAAERQVDEIERRSENLPGAGFNPERDAKALAVLCRVVKELPVDDPAALAGDDLDEASDRDLEAFRDDLARHLARMAEERASHGGAEDHASGEDRETAA